MRPAFLSGLALVALWYGTAIVLAHQAPTGWAYPYSCCSNNDCNMIPRSRVTEEGGGFTIVLLPGDHDMAPNGGTWHVTYQQAKPSPDGEPHICIGGGLRLLCFFIGQGSS